MQFSTIFAIVSAVAVSAIPYAPVSKSNSVAVDASSTDVCGAGNVVSCCNRESNQGNDNNNLLGLGDVLAGSCSRFSIPAALGVSALGGSNCNAGNTFCCPVQQDGQLNVALTCMPLNL